MWLFFSLASAFFAGITAVLAKVGIKNINSNLATALRTIVVLIFAWLMVFIVGSQNSIFEIETKSVIFLILSGIATGGSWLCYFKALQIGDINKVVPIDKLSTVLTMLLAFIFLGEKLTLIKGLSMCVIAVGTCLMVEQKKDVNPNKATSRGWLIYALLAALFASLTAILAKVGIEHVESNLGTAIRTMVVLVMAWLVVFIQGNQKEIHLVDKKSWLFIGLSGIATGLSWLCYYRALQEGDASIVVPIDKLSILITIGCGYIFFKEHLKKKSLLGLFLIVVGTLCMLT